VQVIKKLDQAEVKEKRLSPAERVAEALAGAVSQAHAGVVTLFLELSIILP
jgi:hypothetical protein